jgi:hypothetical protein
MKIVKGVFVGTLVFIVFGMVVKKIADNTIEPKAVEYEMIAYDFRASRPLCFKESEVFRLSAWARTGNRVECKPRSR